MARRVEVTPTRTEGARQNADELVPLFEDRILEMDLFAGALAGAAALEMAASAAAQPRLPREQHGRKDPLAAELALAADVAAEPRLLEDRSRDFASYLGHCCVLLGLAALVEVQLGGLYAEQECLPPPSPCCMQRERVQARANIRRLKDLFMVD